MPEDRLTEIWQVVEPSELPSPPRWMSFSALLEIEACPRRWSLNAALYPSIWDRRGYPRIPQGAAIEGTVVHSAIEIIATALTVNDCKSVNEERAITTLKTLGGFTAVVRTCIDTALKQYEGNPRAAARLESLKRQLDARAPELRSRVQRQISRIKPIARNVLPSVASISPSGQTRLPLSIGSHAEIELQSVELGWHGYVDLLSLSNTHSELRDFKTGAAKDQHELQLRIYALLWARDHQLNPDGALADRLILSYDDREIDIPAPNADLLSSLEAEINHRTKAAIASVQLDSPHATPSIENCTYCPVRHLCGEYWQWLEQRTDGDSPPPQFMDMEITLSKRHGSSSWDGMMVESAKPEKQRAILLRTANLQFDLRPGQHLRVLNVHINSGNSETSDAEERPTVVTMGANSEIFLVSM
jgi:hypothetical protein